MTGLIPVAIGLQLSAKAVLSKPIYTACRVHRYANSRSLKLECNTLRVQRKEFLISLLLNTGDCKSNDVR